MRMFSSMFALFCLLVSSGCSHFDPEVYQESFEKVQKSAQKYADKQQYPESIYLARALVEAEPENAAARKLLDDGLAKSPESQMMVKKGWMGSNLSDRARKTDFPIGYALLLYPLNRFFDAMDLVTVEAGVCIGIGANVSVTEMVGAGAQVSIGEGMIGLNRRHLSIRGTFDDYLELLCFESRYLMEGRGYTGGAYAINAGTLGLKKPSLPIYQTARDYWAIGARVELIVLAANVEIHSLEFWDFLGGLILCDPLHDDIGVTRGISINGIEQDAVKHLMKEARKK